MRARNTSSQFDAILGFGDALFRALYPHSGTVDLFTAKRVNRAIICADRAFPGDCAGFLRSAHPVETGAFGLTLLRWLMTPIEIVGGIFGLFAVGLIVLLIYKSTLTMHEDDQLFLDTTNSHMQEEQTELLTKVNKLTLPMRVFSIGSGVFLLAFLAHVDLPEAERSAVGTGGPSSAGCWESAMRHAIAWRGVLLPICPAQ